MESDHLYSSQQEEDPDVAFAREIGKCYIKYFNIPIEIYKDKRLTANEKFLYALINLLDNERGCFARTRDWQMI